MSWFALQFVLTSASLGIVIWRWVKVRRRYLELRYREYDRTPLQKLRDAVFWDCLRQACADTALSFGIAAVTSLFLTPSIGGPVGMFLGLLLSAMVSREAAETRKWKAQREAARAA